MITVLHLITCLDVGGAETLLFDLVSQSDRGRFRHVVVSMLDEGAFGERMRASGISVHTLRMLRGRPTLRAILKLRSILRSEHPEILQTWMYHADLLGAFVSVLGGPRLVWGVHAAGLDVSKYRRLTGWTRRSCAWLSRVPRVVVVNSEATYRDHLGLGYRPRQWKTIANGFDVDKFRPDALARSSLREELGIPAGTLLIGLIARYDPQKDQATFLQAAANLMKTEPNAHFVLAGTDVTRQNRRLAEQIELLGLGANVHLLGLRADVPRITAALDIAASSSIGESFSNSIAEAMACGIPCVVTDITNLPKLVGDTGIVVPAGNPEAMAKGWQQLIELGHDGRWALGERARTRIEQEFSLGRMVRAYEDLYMYLLGTADG